MVFNDYTKNESFKTMWEKGERARYIRFLLVTILHYDIHPLFMKTNLLPTNPKFV